MKAGAALLVVAAALVAGGAAGARTPAHAQRSAILAAFRSQQGDVAVQKVLVSTADPGYASVGWGFATHGLSAQHDSVLGRSSGAWKILWTRDREAPADGLWVAWPKKASKIETDLDFAAVQAIGLAGGLVDNKSASVDGEWQAVRFVYRKDDRPG